MTIRVNLKSALEKAYAACAIAYKEQEKLLSALHKEEQVLKRLIERKLRTFPIRLDRHFPHVLGQWSRLFSK